MRSRNRFPRTRWASVLIVSTLAVFFGMASKALSQTVTPTVAISASPATGISPMSTTLTWATTGFPAGSTCTASGTPAWTGTKGLSGSQSVTLFAGTYNFRLDCKAASGTATVSWTAPTLNTDGTPISAVAPGALAGFKLYHATTPEGLATATPLVVNDPILTTMVLTELPEGPRYYAATAFNTENVESAKSVVVNNSVALPAAAAWTTVVVNTQPAPPVIVTVSKLVYDLTSKGSIGRLVGNIPLGVGCLGGVIRTWSDGSTFYEVPKSSVTLTRTPRSTKLVGKCAAQTA